MFAYINGTGQSNDRLHQFVSAVSMTNCRQTNSCTLVHVFELIFSPSSFHEMLFANRNLGIQNNLCGLIAWDWQIIARPSYKIMGGKTHYYFINLSVVWQLGQHFTWLCYGWARFKIFFSVCYFNFVGFLFACFLWHGCVILNYYENKSMSGLSKINYLVFHLSLQPPLPHTHTHTRYIEKNVRNEFIPRDHVVTQQLLYVCVLFSIVNGCQEKYQKDNHAHTSEDTHMHKETHKQVTFPQKSWMVRCACFQAETKFQTEMVVICSVFLYSHTAFRVLYALFSRQTHSSN